MAAAAERLPISVGFPGQLPDEDPAETQEWLESLDGLVDHAGRPRARALLLRVLQRAREREVGLPGPFATDYVNTIAPGAEPEFPGDESIERRLRAYCRWNAAVMVHRAQRPDIGVGGHISTYASAAALYEVGFNHFFRGHGADGGGDQIFFQGHASPGIYARAFLEGRLSELQLDGFRQELSHGGVGAGLPSYPHPRLLHGFSEFPTVSAPVLEPTPSPARFNRPHHAGTGTRARVWALGDEMDELARFAIDAGVAVYFCDPKARGSAAATSTPTACCARTCPATSV